MKLPTANPNVRNTVSPGPVTFRILFWNVNKKKLSTEVCSLAISTKADVIVLNENITPSANTLFELKKNVSSDFYIPTVISENRFHCFCRNQEFDMTEVHNGARTSVRKLTLGSDKILLVLVHGVDIRNYDNEARQSFAQSLATEANFVRKDKQIEKLMFLGDFNMNPFDRGMNLAAGLNAMMTRSCAEKGTRRHIEQDYDFYYNPMWSLFGDNTPGPAGTVYDTSAQGPYGWSMLDQVIMHHTLIPYFDSVEILTTAGKKSLKNKNGHPDSNNASDHFPIIVHFRRRT